MIDNENFCSRWDDVLMTQKCRGIFHGERKNVNFIGNFIDPVTRRRYVCVLSVSRTFSSYWFTQQCQRGDKTQIFINNSRATRVQHEIRKVELQAGESKDEHIRRLLQLCKNSRVWEASPPPGKIYRKKEENKTKNRIHRAMLLGNKRKRISRFFVRFDPRTIFSKRRQECARKTAAMLKAIWWSGRPVKAWMNVCALLPEWTTSTVLR